MKYYPGEKSEKKEQSALGMALLIILTVVVFGFLAWLERSEGERLRKAREAGAQAAEDKAAAVGGWHNWVKSACACKSASPVSRPCGL